MGYLDTFKIEQINMIVRDFHDVNTNIDSIKKGIKQIQNELNNNDSLLEDRIKINTEDIG